MWGVFDRGYAGVWKVEWIFGGDVVRRGSVERWGNGRSVAGRMRSWASWGGARVLSSSNRLLWYF